MMEDKKNIFDYLTQVFAIFGLTVTMFIVFAILIGEGTGEYSTLFSLGGRGLTIETLLQLLLLAIIITVLQNVFLTDRWIKTLSIVLRYVLFFLSIMTVIIIMVKLFGWFPLNDVSAWIGFFISFALSMLISITLTRINERMENKKMKEALERYNKKS